MYRYVGIGAWPKELITIGYKLPSFYSCRNDITIGQCYYWEQRKNTLLRRISTQSPGLAHSIKILLLMWLSRRDKFKHLGSKHLLKSVLPKRRSKCLWWLPKYLQATIVLRVRLIWLFHLRHSLLHDWEHPHRLTWLFICWWEGWLCSVSPRVIKGMA